MDLTEIENVESTTTSVNKHYSLWLIWEVVIFLLLKIKSISWIDLLSKKSILKIIIDRIWVLENVEQIPERKFKTLLHLIILDSLGGFELRRMNDWFLGLLLINRQKKNICSSLKETLKYILYVQIKRESRFTTLNY